MSRQRQLARLLVEERKARKLRQQDLAHRLHQHQSFISRLESGARPIDVCEFLNLAKAIGFDPSVALKRIQNGACDGSSLDEALTVVKAAGYRITNRDSPNEP
jgi:transcriptional regulator with XRE-family HTH domain